MPRTITLSDGKKIPAIGWGNGTGGLGKSGQKAVETGVLALKAGILHIDTAQSYYTEKETAEAIKASGLKREDVFVTTKISVTSNTKTTQEDIKRSVGESLGLLGFIPDLLLIHSPFVPEDGKIGEFWTHLENLVEDGTLAGCSLGVSNFRPQDIEEVMKVAKIKPVVNQLEYHPYVITHLEPLLEAHEKYGIVIESYGGLSPVLRHPTGGPIKPVLSKIASKLSTESGTTVDETQVSLLWQVCRGIVAVTSSTKAENLAKIAATERLRDLTEEELTEIEDVGKTVHFRAYKVHMTKDFPEPDLPTGE
ncbi:hypothetical protein TREMEDRAFT_29854 [Tremella mesenterica DSM 1558]|uniref:uncharacterized protein n=1 Tax=Tremella mesenterica (strain ATCC 24925 / CBS 8224 / DSM 1558 / NBRC 9311 / NRRL Y-6157 / RJB 2259-6 / UBC 559-6) TaxID=578456 RepID=UPI0003F493FC|nr:uncharacterized protein TREMEDRAFT_29854 [Tremella mesenterica DSM 1558]EIW69720.1 hypothetical protein TREMEDRAFT_29854 [Tremella mesenterica DSM 1558]